MNLSFDELCEAHGHLCEQLGELDAQYRSEVAHYGDAWPGAAIQVDKLRRVVREVQAEIEAHPEYVAPAAAREPFEFEDADGDIPF